MDADAKRRLKTGTSSAMKRIAEGRRCPKCGRGYALSRSRAGGISVAVCRWSDCGYEGRGQLIEGPTPPGKGPKR